MPGAFLRQRSLPAEFSLWSGKGSDSLSSSCPRCLTCFPELPAGGGGLSLAPAAVPADRTGQRPERLPTRPGPAGEWPPSVWTLRLREPGRRARDRHRSSFRGNLAAGPAADVRVFSGVHRARHPVLHRREDVVPAGGTTGFSADGSRAGGQVPGSRAPGRGAVPVAARGSLAAHGVPSRGCGPPTDVQPDPRVLWAFSPRRPVPLSARALWAGLSEAVVSRAGLTGRPGVDVGSERGREVSWALGGTANGPPSRRPVQTQARAPRGGLGEALRPLAPRWPSRVRPHHHQAPLGPAGVSWGARASADGVFSVCRALNP